MPDKKTIEAAQEDAAQGKAGIPLGAPKKGKASASTREKAKRDLMMARRRSLSQAARKAAQTRKRGAR